MIKAPCVLHLRVENTSHFGHKKTILVPLKIRLKQTQSVYIFTHIANNYRNNILIGSYENKRKVIFLLPSRKKEKKRKGMSKKHAFIVLKK